MSKQVLRILSRKSPSLSSFFFLSFLAHWQDALERVEKDALRYEIDSKTT